jgi:hydroxymethylglutaryl-CoA lyase
MKFDGFPKEVKIVEVGPRDGLQNEKTIIPTDIKINFIKKLIEAGLNSLEATSFVRADKIPQMQDAGEVFQKVSPLNAEMTCLVPNMKGLENALKYGVKSIAVFTATSDQFNMKNINATIEESLERIKPVVEAAKKEDLKIRAYISTVFGCPYQGKTSLDDLFRVMDFFTPFEVDEYSLGDTIGVAVPSQVDDILGKMKGKYDLGRVALHFHDTRGMALTNVLVGLSHGISIFDSSAAGLGGCPYAKGATGNLATEDLLYLLNSLGIRTGVDMDKLINASEEILEVLKKESVSKIHKIMKGKSHE